jgi:hypothetical protein
MPLASREGLTPAAAIARTRRDASRTRVKQVHRLHQRTEQSRSQLWKRQVREWLDQHNQSTDWGPPVKDEVMLVGWFRSIDPKKTGTVSAAEVASFLRGSGVDIGKEDIEFQLAHMGRDPAARFDTTAFVHVMTKASRATHGGNGRDLDKATADLHIMATRRQRMLIDIREPHTRRPFDTYDGFCKEYGVGLRAPKLHGREYHAGLRLAAGGKPRERRPTMMEILNPSEEINAWEKAQRDWEKEAREEARLRAKLGIAFESSRAMVDDSRAGTPNEGRSRFGSVVESACASANGSFSRETAEEHARQRRGRPGGEAAVGAGPASSVGIRYKRAAGLMALQTLRTSGDGFGSGAQSPAARSPGVWPAGFPGRSRLPSSEERMQALLGVSERADGFVTPAASGIHAKAHQAPPQLRGFRGADAGAAAAASGTHARASPPQPRTVAGSASVAHLQRRHSPSVSLGHSASMAVMPGRATGPTPGAFTALFSAAAPPPAAFNALSGAGTPPPAAGPTHGLVTPGTASGLPHSQSTAALPGLHPPTRALRDVSEADGGSVIDKSMKQSVLLPALR